VYRSGFGPLMGGVFVAQFPYLVRGPYSPADNRQQDSSWAQSVDDMTYYGAAPADVTTRDVKRCLESIELMLRTQTSPSETVSSSNFTHRKRNKSSQIIIVNHVGMHHGGTCSWRGWLHSLPPWIPKGIERNM
jgi:hypothetical protein